MIHFLGSNKSFCITDFWKIMDLLFSSGYQKNKESKESQEGIELFSQQ